MFFHLCKYYNIIVLTIYPTFDILRDSKEVNGATITQGVTVNTLLAQANVTSKGDQKMDYKKVKNGKIITVKKWDDKITITDKATGEVLAIKQFSDHLVAVSLARQL